MARRATTRTLAVLTVIGLAASACSNDDDQASDTTAATETTAAPDTAPDTTTGGGEFEGTFPLGFVQPNAGLLAEISRGQVLGLDLAMQDINAAGGVNGAEATVTAAIEPLGGDPLPAIGELLDGGAVALVGPVSSSGAIAARPELASRGAVACSASATAPAVTLPDVDDPDAVSPVVRTALPDQFFVAAFADLLIERLADTADASVAIVARDDAYGQSISSALSASLIAREINASVIPYNPFAVIFGPQVTQVQAASPSLVVMVSFEESVRLLRELVAAGVAADSIIGLDGSARPNLAESASPDDPAALDGFSVYSTTGNLAWLQRAFETDGATDLAFSAQAYDCAVVLALASIAAESTDGAAIRAEIAGVTTDGVACTSYADCVDLLAAGEDIDYDGPSGALSLNEAGDPGAGRISTLTVTGGEWDITDTADVDVRQQERDDLLFAVANLTTQIQISLTILGFYEGPIDGVWSDELSASVAAFQASVGLPPTGVWDAATDEALRARLGTAGDVLGASISEIQVALTELGFYSGPIDGRWNAETIAAVRALQAQLGVPQTGIIDLATLQAIYAQGVVTGQTPPTTTAPPATTVPATTVPPTTPPETVPPTPLPDEAVGDVLGTNEAFTSLWELIVAANLPSGLNPLKSYTIFAPVNDAFGDTPPAPPTTPEETEALQDLLAGHIVENPAGVLLTSDVVAQLDGQQAVTLAGTVLTVDVLDDGTITLVNSEGDVASVVAPFDLQALTTEGSGIVSVIHGVDIVIPLGEVILR